VGERRVGEKVMGFIPLSQDFEGEEEIERLVARGVEMLEEEHNVTLSLEPGYVERPFRPSPDMPEVNARMYTATVVEADRA